MLNIWQAIHNANATKTIITLNSAQIQYRLVFHHTTLNWKYVILAQSVPQM